MKNIFLLFSFSFFLQFNSFSQADFYHPNTIQEIRIYFEQSNWDEILDDFFVAGDQERLLCNISINGTQLDSVGIRYKGYSSVSVDRTKNPFNIKLDYVKGDQTYDGIDKVKLSNVIQDPSFLREVMSYEIARKYMPSSRANYAKVYINDEYWGLYTNVESVDKDFLARTYGSNNNAFIKCNPETLDLDGENSNLENHLGTDSLNYTQNYDLRSDYGWADLYELIEVLNENPVDIESVLNVDRTLWMHAFNYALVNFDSYVGYAQNYYLYKDENGQFNPVLWDLNQSFASYRLSDASEFWNGFSIEQAKTIDPLFHYNSVSVVARPLMRNLFENDTYRRMFLAHMRTIIEENFENEAYITRGEHYQTLIDDAVQTDPNKFYTYDDFLNNLNSTTSDLVEYPGITDLMDARTDYLLNYEGISNAPDITDVSYSPQTLSIGDDIHINASIVNASKVILMYRFGGNGLFQEVEMLDDGTQNDGSANDGVYGIQIQDVGNNVQYYVYAENDESGRFSPERAAFEFHNILSNINVGDIVINEFMASNQTTIADEEGEYDDWIELYNTTDFDISTAGLYLTDNPDNLDKWALPDVIIEADGYLVIWADEDGDQGELHANFKLSAGGESLTLTDVNSTILDEIIFGDQNEDISTGRYPNGTGDFIEMFPTPNAENLPTNVNEAYLRSSVTLFPNPASAFIHLKFEDQIPFEINIQNVNGQTVSTQKNELKEGIVSVDLTELSEGIYSVFLLFEEGIVTKKMIVIR